MTLTEEEAREKACHRFPNNPNSGCHCVGSYCMAWRWARIKESKSFLTAVAKHMSEQEKPNFNESTQAVFASGKYEKPTEGYCGLAGKPE